MSDVVVSRALRALVARGVAVPAPLREAVATAAREGEVVMLALDADPTLAPWLTEPARRALVIDGHLEVALMRAAEAFAAAGDIGRVALLKGSASAHLVYTRSALRFRRDIDLLVDDVPHARAALAVAGFVDRVDPTRTSRGPAAVRTWPMAMPAAFGEVEIDLHAALVEAPWCHPSRDALLAAAQAAQPLPLTSPPDTLVHTAIHLAENGFRQPLKAWVDVDRLARLVDPDETATRARLHGARTALWIALDVSARWFGTPTSALTHALGTPLHAPLLRYLLAGDGTFPHRRPLARGPARHLARFVAADGITERTAYTWWALARRFV